MRRSEASRELRQSLDVDTMHPCLCSKADLPQNALMNASKQNLV
jgi:hypothetical protein